MPGSGWEQFDQENRARNAEAEERNRELIDRLLERTKPEQREERRGYGLGSVLIAGLIGWLAGRKSRD